MLFLCAIMFKLCKLVTLHHVNCTPVKSYTLYLNKYSVFAVFVMYCYFVTLEFVCIMVVTWFCWLCIDQRCVCRQYSIPVRIVDYELITEHVVLLPCKQKVNGATSATVGSHTRLGQANCGWRRPSGLLLLGTVQKQPLVSLKCVLNSGCSICSLIFKKKETSQKRWSACFPILPNRFNSFEASRIRMWLAANKLTFSPGTLPQEKNWPG